jgi:hypothetical protein
VQRFTYWTLAPAVRTIGIWLHKITYNRQQYLMACRPPTDEERRVKAVDILFIDFYQMGTHENFYATLEKYLKS